MQEKKGIGFDLDLEEFANPTTHSYYSAYTEGGLRYVARKGESYQCWGEALAGVTWRETNRSETYDYQVYLANEDGSLYNIICEFQFRDEKIGYGYFYTIERDPT